MKLNKIVLMISLITLCSISSASSYDDAIAQWKSHNDVANWLNSNFSFEQSRLKKVIKRLKKQGPSGLLFRNPATLYEENHGGYCADSANFAIQSLNRIDPSYNARWVFIKNEKGRPHHWVTAFDFEEKLYIMDYGAGKKWEEMQGVHGPYNSLSEYREFLASLNLPGLEVGIVKFNKMPGQEG